MARYKVNQTTGELTLLDEVGDDVVCWDDVNETAPSISDPYVTQSVLEAALVKITYNDTTEVINIPAERGEYIDGTIILS